MITKKGLKKHLVISKKFQNVFGTYLNAIKSIKKDFFGTKEGSLEVNLCTKLDS